MAAPACDASDTSAALAPLLAGQDTEYVEASLQLRHVQMSTPKHTEALASVNAKLVAQGESLPAVKLKDGTTVQTGTVATMLHNIALYNAGQRGQIEDELKLAIPTLVKVGLFELFPVEDWISGNNAGRSYVGQLAKEFFASEQG